ncbi:MAG: DUF998 domain-containing protein [Planctomycetaceae bacterium]|nr:DUF998 domain-containing protein [Planctomycetaceae bacterium]
MKQKPKWLKIAIAQGIAAPFIFTCVAFIGGLLYPGYSHTSQAISELSANGASNQRWLLVAFALTELQKIVFGVGFYSAVWDMGRALKGSALSMIAIGVIGLGFAKFPMDQIGTPVTFDGQMHIAIVSISAVLATIAITLSGVGWRFVPGGKALVRWSFSMLAIMVASGMLSGLAIAIEWPRVGIWQRVNIAAFSIWQIATAIYLLRRV